MWAVSCLLGWGSNWGCERSSASVRTARLPATASPSEAPRPPAMRTSACVYNIHIYIYIHTYIYLCISLGNQADAQPSTAAGRRRHSRMPSSSSCGRARALDLPCATQAAIAITMHAPPGLTEQALKGYGCSTQQDPTPMHFDKLHPAPITA